jgi:GT2 family glycosyltransferase
VNTRTQNEPNISVIIPSISISDHLLALAKSIKAQEEVKISDIIVVVRDLATNDFHAISPDVHILQQTGSGRADAINFATDYAQGTILVYIDEDCIPANKNWLKELTQSFLERSDIEIVSGRVVVPPSSFIQRFIRWVNGLGTPDYGVKDFYLDSHFQGFPGTNLAVRKLALHKLGGFDDNLVVGEDLDFCLRAFNMKMGMKYSSNALIYHFHRRNLSSLLRHAWKSGRGSWGFIQKYGFWNTHLRGTSISFLFVLFSPIILYLLFVSSLYGLLLPILGIAVAILYSSLIIKFWETARARMKTIQLKEILFPPILAFYMITSGLGVLSQYLFHWSQK